MKTLDAEVRVVIKDSETGEIKCIERKFNDLYVFDGKIRLPKIKLDVSEMGKTE